MNKLNSILLAIGIAAITEQIQAADHGHLNAGALGKTNNAPLYFANGSDFITTSGYVKTLTYTNGGTYAGYYQGNVTLTALPATSANAGPDPAAPALGSFIQAQLVSVTGPAGGAFAFWDTGATNPSISLVSGQTGTNLWRLSESDGSPGLDPYGHIHGRRFSATKPGIYKVSFRLFDTSTNGPGGGPIHKPSGSITVYFQADVNLQSIEPDEDHSHIRFSAPLGGTWQLEVSDSLGVQAKWTSVGAPVSGDDYFHEVEDEHPVQGQRYFRIRSVTP